MMNIFEDLGNMNFKEAYNEAASTLYAEGKEFVQEKKDQMKTEDLTTGQMLEQVKDRIFMG